MVAVLVPARVALAMGAGPLAGFYLCVGLRLRARDRQGMPRSAVPWLRSLAPKERAVLLGCARASAC